MNMLKKLLLLSFIVFLFPNFENEELVYDVEIKKGILPTIKAGKCNFIFNKINEENYEIKIITQTTGKTNFLVSFFDMIKLTTEKDFTISEIDHIKIQNKKKKEVYSKIDKNNKSIYSNGKKLNFYNENLFDPYSLIYFLRTQNLKIGNNYKYKIFDGGKKLKGTILNVLDFEKIKVPFGEFKCFHLKPNNKMKNGAELEIWYSNDETKIPVQIKLEAKIGMITLKLKKIISQKPS